MPYSLLLVEDDAEIADFVRRGLRAEGYLVETRSEGRDLAADLGRAGYDLVILDRMLPDAEGADLCRRMRAAGSEAMILMLTARDGLDDKLEGLGAGADDYMTKPFAFSELLARIEALLRRRAPQNERSEIQVGDLGLDLDTRVVRFGEEELPLTATEFELLAFLARNAGRVMSRSDILRGVWGYDFDPNTNIVEVYITYLRRKISRTGRTSPIRNVRGVGYLLTEEGPAGD